MLLKFLDANGYLKRTTTKRQYSDTAIQEPEPSIIMYNYAKHEIKHDDLFVYRLMSISGFLMVILRPRRELRIIDKRPLLRTTRAITA